MSKVSRKKKKNLLIFSLTKHSLTHARTPRHRHFSCIKIGISISLFPIIAYRQDKYLFKNFPFRRKIKKRLTELLIFFVDSRRWKFFAGSHSFSLSDDSSVMGPLCKFIDITIVQYTNSFYQSEQKLSVRTETCAKKKTHTFCMGFNRYSRLHARVVGIISIFHFGINRFQFRLNKKEKSSHFTCKTTEKNHFNRSTHIELFSHNRHICVTGWCFHQNVHV